ncbi:hypothetical protein SANTM175S_09906 [Streptomyces antimycoticus]
MADKSPASTHSSASVTAGGAVPHQCSRAIRRHAIPHSRHDQNAYSSRLAAPDLCHSGSSAADRVPPMMSGTRAADSHWA